MTATLAERRNDALKRLDALRRQRGSAILDDTPFDDSEIVAVEHEIDALAQAEAETLRRERDAEAARIARLTTSLSGDLGAAEADRLAAISRAEKGARELVAGLADALECATAIRNLAAQLDRPVPTKLDQPALVGRLSQRLVAILATLPGHRYRFGAVEWRSRWRHPEDDWAEQEQKELLQDIDHLTGDE